MSNPVVVVVTRGSRVESSHGGSGAVVDAGGRLVFSFGDVATPVFPRSAVKALQALPLIESGAAERLRLSDAEIALAVASHSGEPRHVATAAAMLEKAAAGVEHLACGGHWPMNADAARALAKAGGEPSALHNNCSGKHAGFLCLACDTGWSRSGYERAEHPLQREIHAVLEAESGERLGEDRRGTDGCSIPTWAISLRGLARAFARFGSGQGASLGRAAASARIRRAVAADPFFVAGTGRFDTEAMRQLGARAFTKTGAEGVFCAALPELGLGLAVKADDGAGRAAEAMIGSLLLRFLRLEGEEHEALSELATPKLRNWRGTEVGAIRAAGPLL